MPIEAKFFSQYLWLVIGYSEKKETGFEVYRTVLFVVYKNQDKRENLTTINLPT